MLEMIEKLLQAAGIKQASDAIASMPPLGVVALPDNYTERDFERFMAERRRQRGVMNTHIDADFATYVADGLETGARIFVDEQTMSATAVLNLGTPANPGHADNIAVLTSKQTAAYKALTAIANGQGHSQTAIAEFLEDWVAVITCLKNVGDDYKNLAAKTVISSIRAITIEGLTRVKSEEQSLSAARTTFESIAAKEDDAIPTMIRFKCVPYVGFEEREFCMRLGILTDSKPKLVLRIIKLEEHQEQMGQELATKLRTAIGSTPPVLLGKYAVSR